MPFTKAPDRQRTRSLLTRRNFLKATAASIAGFAFYSNEIARHEIDVTQPTFRIANLPPAFDGFRIAQISDLHLEDYTEDYFLRRVIDRVNKLAPDMVLVTGDFVSRGPLSNAVAFDAAGRCAEMLAALRCPIRYGILGNHDCSVDRRVVRNHMEDNGLPLLVNRSVRIERGGEYFYLAGLDDVEFGQPNLAAGLPADHDAPTLLMVHEPDFADYAATQKESSKIDLMLSGHTHGGQVLIPGLSPLALPPNGRMYPQGHFNVGSFQLYVNRGIGTVGIPFRLNCPPEITLATLRPAVSIS